MSLKLPSRDEELLLEVEGFNLRDLPINRAAEYLRLISKVVGAANRAHISAFADGSMHASIRVDGDAAAKSSAWMARAARPDGGPARDAFEKLNQAIAADGGVGVLINQTRNQRLLIFPGRDRLADPFPAFWEEGALRGELKSLDKKTGDGKFGGHIRTTVEIQSFICSEDMARNLREHLWTPIEVSGRGHWQRQGSGHWRLLVFEAVEFRPLKKNSLKAIRKKLQDNGGLGLNDDASLEILRNIR